MARETLYRDWQWHYRMAEMNLEKAVFSPMDDGTAQLFAQCAQVHATLAAIGRTETTEDPTTAEVDDEQED